MKCSSLGMGSGFFSRRVDEVLNVKRIDTCVTASLERQHGVKRAPDPEHERHHWMGSQG